MEKSLNRDYEIVLFGATGFTGRLVSAYLAEHAGDLKWAIAGRNKKELEKVKADIVKINSECERVDIIIADSKDQHSIDQMVKSSKVIISTAGPFGVYSVPVVDACVRFSTHYCDITGESPFVKGIIEKYHTEAEKKGTLIVPCCGFDSIPSDLGTYALLTQIASKESNFNGCGPVKCYVQLRGKPSGGTLNTMLTMAEDPSDMKDLADPYLLAKDKAQITKLKHRVKPLEYSSDIRAWTIPFVMETVNRANVYRSNSLFDNQYGTAKTGFKYSERLVCKSLFSAILQLLFLFVMLIFVYISFLRNCVLRRILPKPGTGPSKEEMKKGFFSLTLVTQSKESGKEYRMKVKGGEPGYLETAKMVSECGICLATQRNKLTCKGGVVPPAVAMGHVLVDRLHRAGITFSSV